MLGVEQIPPPPAIATSQFPSTKLLHASSIAAKVDEHAVS